MIPARPLLALRVPALIAAALAAAGCLPGPADFDTRVAEVCVSGLIPFEGGAGRAVTTEVSLQGVAFDKGDLGGGGAVTLERLTLVPGPGIGDFDFAERVEVDLTAPGAPALRVLDVPAVPDTAFIDQDGDPDLDMGPYLDSERAALAVTFLGDVPATPWSVELDACLLVRE